MILILIVALLVGSPLAVILIVSAMSDWASAKDWEASERNAEIRHQELLEATRKYKAPKFDRITRRRYIKDRHGNILAEEVIVDYNDDYDDEDFEEE